MGKTCEKKVVLSEFVLKDEHFLQLYAIIKNTLLGVLFRG
jgi:hypothetical protein